MHKQNSVGETYNNRAPCVNICKVVVYHSVNNSSLYFYRLAPVVQPNIGNPYTSFDCIYIYIHLVAILGGIFSNMVKNTNYIFHILTYI